MRQALVLVCMLAACGGTVCEVAAADVVAHRDEYVPDRVSGGSLDVACASVSPASAQLDVAVRYRLGGGFSVPAGPWAWRVDVRDGRVVKRVQIDPMDTGDDAP